MTSTADTSDRGAPNPSGSPCTLRDVLITEQLQRRVPHPRQADAEKAAYFDIARQLDGCCSRVLQSLTDAAIALCMDGKAGTSGVSLLEDQPDGSVLFRWTVLSGTLSGFVNGTTPRDFSPCGVCLDTHGPVLFAHPERYFTYFQSAGVPFVEGLVLPFSVADRPRGTLWIITHHPGHQFDSEDVRVMTDLCGFASLAYSTVTHGAER